MSNTSVTNTGNDRGKNGSQNNSDLNDDHSTRTEPMDLSLYIITKVEKISQALYLITNYLPIEEPFRRSVREKSLSVIDQLYQIQIGGSANIQALTTLVTNRLQEMSTVLNIGTKAGLMSDMNHAVLTEEIRNLISLVSESLTDTLNDSKTTPTLESDFFKTTHVKKAVQNKMIEGRTYDQVFDSGQVATGSGIGNLAKRDDVISGHVNKKVANTNNRNRDTNQHNTSTNSNARQNKFSSTTGSEPSNNKLVDTIVSDPVANTGRSIKRNGNNHSKRQRTILALFRDIPEISISDVQTVVEGCSQKTMQRELKTMTEQGLLEKKGKKRWSTYVIGSGIDLESELRTS